MFAFRNFHWIWLSWCAETWQIIICSYYFAYTSWGVYIYLAEVHCLISFFLNKENISKKVKVLLFYHCTHSVGVLHLLYYLSWFLDVSSLVSWGDNDTFRLLLQCWLYYHTMPNTTTWMWIYDFLFGVCKPTIQDGWRLIIQNTLQ